MSFASCLLAGALAMSAFGAGLESISSAELCGRCHRAIHEALESAESELGTAVRKTCLRRKSVGKA